mmetsp:Transcript_43689/g.75574  ORF Transcript_43689/g.75574 Transcript_43689/m.75574 type:complete len:250 (+) Transcript_43689:407-1156(+)
MGVSEGAVDEPLMTRECTGLPAGLAVLECRHAQDFCAGRCAALRTDPSAHRQRLGRWRMEARRCPAQRGASGAALRRQRGHGAARAGRIDCGTCRRTPAGCRHLRRDAHRARQFLSFPAPGCRRWHDRVQARAGSLPTGACDGRDCTGTASAPGRAGHRGAPAAAAWRPARRAGRSVVAGAALRRARQCADQRLPGHALRAVRGEISGAHGPRRRKAARGVGHRRGGCPARRGGGQAIAQRRACRLHLR